MLSDQPNHGTLLAFFTSRVGCKEIGPSSALLQKLNHDCSALRHLNVTSFWTPLDLIVLPAKSSCPSFGTNKEIPVLAHPLMILHDLAKKTFG
jgi:triacylglycerol lipase